MTNQPDIDIQGLIFDLDGVITDTAEFHYQSWKQLGEEEGIPFTRADNEHLRGISRRESLSRFLNGRKIDEKTAQAWMARKNAIFQSLSEQLAPEHILPGVQTLLQEAQDAGLKLGIGSASRNARTVLERLGLLEPFEVIGDGYSVVNTKPAPDLFVWVAGGLGFSPKQIVVFEDAEAGIDAALTGGFYTVGLGTANVSRAHIILPDLTDTRLDDLQKRLEEVVHKTES